MWGTACWAGGEEEGARMLVARMLAAPVLAHQLLERCLLAISLSFALKHSLRWMCGGGADALRWANPHAIQAGL